MLYPESTDHRPLLKIGPLTNLQDARSSAAVGFDLISFSLERGSMKKLPSSLIWNITQWLSGPEIILELNRISLPELEEIGETVSYSYLSFPFDEWKPDLLKYNSKYILRADERHTALELAQALAAANRASQQLWIELSIMPEQLHAYADINSDCLIHFPDTNQLQHFISENPYNPFGFCLGQEAEEEDGMLDYERIDELLKIYTDRYSENE